MPKMVNLASFWKTEAYAQTVSILIGQKLVENAKIENLICDILGDFKHCENVLKLRSERKKMCQH